MPELDDRQKKEGLLALLFFACLKHLKRISRRKEHSEIGACRFVRRICKRQLERAYRRTYAVTQAHTLYRIVFRAESIAAGTYQSVIVCRIYILVSSRRILELYPRFHKIVHAKIGRLLVLIPEKRQPVKLHIIERHHAAYPAREKAVGKRQIAPERQTGICIQIYRKVPRNRNGTHHLAYDQR